MEIVKFLRRLLRTIRANWPGTQILIRADSHYCCPEVIDFLTYIRTGTQIDSPEEKSTEKVLLSNGFSGFLMT
jgi:hypothetical protein